MAQGKLHASDLGLLILRLALGGIMIAHGVPKLMAASGGLEGFTAFIQSAVVDKFGLPLPAKALAIATIAAEIGGGALVILGLVTRLGALAIAVVMVVAMVSVHLPNGFFIVGTATEATFQGWQSVPDKVPVVKVIPHGYEYNVALLGMALCLVFTGGGALALMPKKKKIE